MPLLDACIDKLSHFSQTLCALEHHVAPVDCGDRVICMECGVVVERIPREAAQLSLIAQLDLENWAHSVMEVRTS